MWILDFDEDLTMTLEENEVNDNRENQKSEYDFVLVYFCHRQSIIIWCFTFGFKL